MNLSGSSASPVAATAGRDQFSFAVFRGRAGLRALGTDWAKVFRGIARPHFFQEYDWYDLILETWPAAAENVFFLVAYQRGEPLAICPLQSSRTSEHGIPVRMLAPPNPNEVAYSDFVYARNPESAGLFPALLRELRSSREIQCDLLTLPRMLSTPTDNPFVEGDGESSFVHSSRGVCYYFKCDQGIDAIQSRISSGLRKHLRRCRRQLAGIGRMEVVSSREPVDLPRLFEEFLKLEASGWKGEAGEGTAIRLHPDLVQFYSGLMSRFAHSGRCEINLLRLDGRSIAGQFCLISKGTWYHLKIAYDEAFHEHSPGFVLLENVLTRLCLDPSVHTANFLTGAEWACRWHPLHLDVTRVIGRNHTLLGALALQQVKARRFLRTRGIPFLRGRPTEPG